MNSLTDQQLLVEYAERRAEAAFAELVRRHIDLVHSAALRMVRDPHLAEDVTQNVFVALASQARRLTERAVLSGWLHCTAHHLAANAIRSDVRRRAREEEAASVNDNDPDSADDWERIAPELDAALDELKDEDRDALLLRYFEKKTAQEIAERLGISAEAAQKRVSRAVDRLRESFAKRGVTVAAGGIIVAISTHAVQAAPVGLAIAIGSVGALAGTAAATATGTAVQTIVMTTLQKTIVTATVALLAGAGIYETHKATQLRGRVNVLEQQQIQTVQQVQQLQRERDEARAQLAALRVEKERGTNDNSELLRLRGMAGVARKAMGEAEDLRAQLVRQTNEAANNPITGAMADAMKQAMENRMKEQLSRMTSRLSLTPDQVDAAREILLRQADTMSAGVKQVFTGKLDKQELNRLSKESGNVDEQIKALLTPEQHEAFPEYQRKEAEHNANVAANQEALQLQSTLSLTPEQRDRVSAALHEIVLNQLTGKPMPSNLTQAEAVEWALEQKVKALEPILTESQLENYRKQQALQAKLIKDLMQKMENSEESK